MKAPSDKVVALTLDLVASGFDVLIKVDGVLVVYSLKGNVRASFEIAWLVIDLALYDVRALVVEELERKHEEAAPGLVAALSARRVCPHAPAERNDACRLGICNVKASGPARMIGTSPETEAETFKRQLDEVAAEAFGGIHPNRRAQILEDVGHAIDHADSLACDTEHTSAIRTLCAAVAKLATLAKGFER